MGQKKVAMGHAEQNVLVEDESIPDSQQCEFANKSSTPFSCSCTRALVTLVATSFNPSGARQNLPAMSYTCRSVTGAKKESI